MRQKVFISPRVSESVLTVGSQYKNHRGGIGGVIETYAKYFPTFKYVCSYGTSENKIVIISKFLISLLQISTLFIQDKDIKLVHIHGAAKGSFFRKYIIFRMSKSLWDKKVIFHCHGSEMEKFYLNSPSFVKKVMRDFFNNADSIISLSNSWSTFFYQNFTPKSVIVLENIVEEPLEMCRYTQVKQNLPLNFLFMGALGNRKGIFDLLEVIAAHKTDFLGKLKLVVGGNGEVDRLQRFITKNQLEEIVIYRGWVSGNEKAILYREADVYILPSYNEGLPLSILEAMACGLPVISTNVGGIPEVVHNNENGFVIKPGDKDALLQQIMCFIKNPEMVEKMGAESLRIVQPYYAKSVIPKLESIYKNVLHNL